MLLALDTSTHQASIALVHDGQLLAELTWEVGRRHSQELLDRVQWLCASCGAHPADLTGVAVARGPGSFNGARVAVTTAKLLAFSLAIPVYGASTLDVIARGCVGARGTLLAVMEAGRGELYVSEYVAGEPPSTSRPPEQAVVLAPDLWRVGEPWVQAPEALMRDVEDAPLICGEWRTETRAALESAGGDRIRFAPEPGGRHASWLAELVAPRIARGEADAAATLEPLYVRRPAITLPAGRHTIGAATAPTLARQAHDTTKGVASALCH